MIPYLLIGITYGITAGFSPGPLLILVIAETLKHSWKEGLKVALAPLLTDVPIILVTLLILSRLSEFEFILGIISLLGFFFLIYLGYQNLKVRIENTSSFKTNSLKKGILVNFLSPHPYLFWMLIGAPTTIKAYEVNLSASFLFISGFYLFIVGAKMGVALLADKSKQLLNTKAFKLIIKAMGVVLIILALLLLKDALNHLDVLKNIHNAM